MEFLGKSPVASRHPKPSGNIHKNKGFNSIGQKNTAFKLITLCALIWFIASLLIVPNINTLVSVFWQDGAFTTRAFTRLFNSTRAVNSLRNSFVLAPVLSITVSFVGLSLVLITDYFKIFGAKVLKLGYMTSLLYSGIILVSGYVFLYGQNGYITNLLASVFPGFNTGWFEGFWAVLFVMTFAATGPPMIFLKNALKNVDFQTIEAAQNMGASPIAILRRVVVPVLTPALTAVTVFTFIQGLSAIAAPLLVGGSSFQTINPMILSFSAMPGSRDLASLMALFLGLASLVLIGCLTWLERRGHYLSVSKVKTEMVKQKIKSPVFNALAHIYAYALFLIYVAPVVLIILFSFTNSATIARRELSLYAFTLDNYIQVLSSAASYRPLFVSATYAFLASAGLAVLILFVCRIITKHKSRLSIFIEYSFMIPWLLPTVLIALGLIHTFSRPQWFMFNQALTGTMGIMVVGYLILRIPFTLRLTKSAFFSVDNTLEDAAKSLGGRPLYTFFKIVLPVVLPSVLAVFALNFNFLLTEFDMSMFLFHPLAVPLGVEMQNLTVDGASDNLAITFVYSVLTMIVAGIVLYVVYGRASRGKA